MRWAWLVAACAAAAGGAPREKYAVAVLLTTKPSGKADGWKPRSVKAAPRAGGGPLGDACAAGPTLCAVLVLRRTVAMNGRVPDADFVALVDAPCPAPLRASLEANEIVAAEMDFGRHAKLFDDYLLMRKFYVFKLSTYDKVLLLDTDTIVVGSLAHIFRNDWVCGRALEAAPPDDERCWPEVDRDVCRTDRPPLALAQQTAGTPVLTAFFAARPSAEAWDGLAAALDKACGRGAVCNRRRIFALGWAANSSDPIPKALVDNPVKSHAPHAWALRAKTGRRKRLDASPWEAMGAGFTDQGFAEHHLALNERGLYSVSHRTCKLKYVHFNMPPKPWFCPGKHCDKHRAYRATDPVDLRWGGHKCAADWWWQYVTHRPHLNAPPRSCAAKCLAALDKAQAGRAAFTDAAMRNYTPACKDWSPAWPPLDRTLRPPDAYRGSLFAPIE